jgi:pyridoxal phosphate enzyme (YggS family)
MREVRLLGDIKNSLKAVKKRIAEAAKRAGRDPTEVKLVAVSKGRDPDRIMELAQAGQSVFGENRAQELRDKLQEIDEELEWHFIGHLQRNKVNMVVGKVALIHSLDSERLAKAVDHRATALGIRQDVLIQVNVSREESKYGVDEKGVYNLLKAALSLPGLKVRGLMTMAPFMENMEGARPYFVQLREMMDELNAAESEAGLDLLSMGMTQDFEVAVEEGANIVRIGTAIFSG